MKTNFYDDDVEWVDLDARIITRSRGLKSILRSVREKQILRASDVDREMRMALRLREAVEAASTLPDDYRENLMDRVLAVFVSLEFLCIWARDFTPMSTQAAGAILGRKATTANRGDTLTSCRERVELLLQARMYTKEFWDLARELTEDVDTALSAAIDITEVATLCQYRAIIQWVAPAQVFEDRTRIKSPTRYGHHATRITSIVVSGHPGSGKRN